MVEVRTVGVPTVHAAGAPMTVTSVGWCIGVSVGVSRLPGTDLYTGLSMYYAQAHARIVFTASSRFGSHTRIHSHVKSESD